MKIGKHKIGIKYTPKIVAEMSGNHKQSLSRSLKLVDIALKSGAHFLKLQTFKPESMTINSKNKQFIVKNPNSLWDKNSLFNLYKKSAMPWEWQKKIILKCKKNGLECFSSPFDKESFEFLESLNVPAYKIASFEITHLPLIDMVSKSKKPIIISTGMASKKEISQAIKVVKKNNNNKIILMKCTSNYPSEPSEANLKTIVNMRRTFNCEIGLSDHTIGIGTSIASVAYGASIIEKHFTINNNDGAVDSKFSMEPKQLKQLVNETNNAWHSKGHIKYGTSSRNENKNKIFRRSVFTKKELKKNHIIKIDDLIILRPKIGLEPNQLNRIVGKKITRDLKKFSSIKAKLIK
tara:strand:+ start:4102 stop:5148 length:1047 start_codon:yes stop_codon:yes gene_type:complete